MFPRQLPEPEGEVDQSCETSSLGFSICHDFFTFRPVPESNASAAGGVVLSFLCPVDIPAALDMSLLIATHFLKDLFTIMLDIQRMEKLEFGGLKGKLYSEQAVQMYNEFIRHCQALQRSDTNPLDIDTQVKQVLLLLMLLNQMETFNNMTRVLFYVALTRWPSSFSQFLCVKSLHLNPIEKLNCCAAKQ